jgi:uncharacterized protein (TIGR02246 family)
MHRLLLALLVASMTPGVMAQGSPANARERAADVDVIKRVVSDATAGWDAFDAARACAEYADDAYFFNAFGRERRGKAAITELITRVLASPGFRAGNKGPLQFVGIDFVTPDLVIVHTVEDTLGQQQMSGAELGPRRTHIFRLMRRVPSGWQTHSFIVSDERSGGTLAPDGKDD